MNERPGYSSEVRERAGRMMPTGEHEHTSRWAAVQPVAAKICCTPQTLLAWLNKMEIGSGVKRGATSYHAACMKERERENREIKRANETFPKASAFFPDGARPKTEVLVGFIDQHREAYGVDPICKVLPIAPSTYHRLKELTQQPDRRCDRAKRDEQLTAELQRTWKQNRRVYGANKVWKQLNREGIPSARCTMEGLMIEWIGLTTTGCYVRLAISTD